MEAKIGAEGGWTGGGWTFNFLSEHIFKGGRGVSAIMHQGLLLLALSLTAAKGKLAVDVRLCTGSD